MRYYFLKYLKCIEKIRINFAEIKIRAQYMIVDLISKSAKYIKRHLEYKSLDKNVPF